MRKSILATNIILCIILVGCNRDDNNITREDETEMVYIEGEDETETTSLEEDEWIWERKDTSSMTIDGENVTFSVPDGLYSTGITTYDISGYETFFNEDMLESYSVLISRDREFSDIDEYGRWLYSYVETSYSDSAKLTVTEEVTDSGIVVKMIKVVVPSNSGGYFIKIYSGTVLPSGIIFEVDAKVTEVDPNVLDFDNIKDFYNDL